MFQSALDADPEDLHPDAREFVAEVRKFGWMATHIYASKVSPSFTYTTGLCALKVLPEFILFGLPMEAAHGLLHNLVGKAESAGAFPAGLPIPDLLRSVDVFLFPTCPKKHSQYLLRSGWFYGTDAFPCQQLVYPDKSGRFPWEDGVDPGFRDFQPDLTEGGWVSNLRQ